MNDLSQFQKFGKKQERKENSVKEVWCYTRVSSKDQENNYSLKNQEVAAKQFAEENGYQLVRTFGETYESGKDDFSRTEFTRLLTEVKNSRTKPFAIIVYKMNRFSRSGGKSIALANELVLNQGVNLIEIVSGIDTTTDKGRNELNRKLLAAESENINKLEHTIPGLKSFVKAGNWLGVAPFGYEHHGTKVTDFSKRSVTQEIRLNKIGKVLRNAWQWKIDGNTDSEIIKKLSRFGVEIRKQKLSAMWRNVFYCGLISHKFLDGEVIVGNHQPMISQSVFLKVQKIIEGNNQGYKVSNESNDRPLAGTLFCPVCGLKLTGYLNRQRGRHYYKCNSCNGVSINADTPTANRYKKNFGAHNLFVELLDSYQLDEKYLNAFTHQVKTIFSHTDKSNKNEEVQYKKRLSELKSKLETMEEKYACGDLAEHIYDKFHSKYENEIADLEAKFDTSGIDLSNIKNNLKKAINFSQNISKHWVSGSINHKQRIQKLVFPEGIRIDTNKRQYLTSKVNSLFSAKREFIRDTEGDKKEKPTVFGGLSYLVAGVGLYK